MKTEQTYELLQPIVASIDKSVVCQSYIDNMDGSYTLLCANTKWLTTSRSFTILTTDYFIKEIVPNVSITVTGPIAPPVLSFDIYEPFFIHGTVISSKEEYDIKSASTLDKTPFIWLHEVTQEVGYADSEDIRDRDSQCDLYFMVDCDFDNWLNKDHDLNAIKPMRNLVNEFIKAITTSQYIGVLTANYTVTNHARWGTYVDFKGHVGQIFNDNLSGCNLKITIPFMKPPGCTDLTIDPRPAPGYVLDSLGNVVAVLYSNETYTITGGACLPVTIKNIDNDSTITTVASGGTYYVEVLNEIVDTVDSNTSTIIDPIN